MSFVIFENDPQMNAGSFFFVLGCGKNKFQPLLLLKELWQHSQPWGNPE